MKGAALLSCGSEEGAATNLTVKVGVEAEGRCQGLSEETRAEKKRTHSKEQEKEEKSLLYPGNVRNVKCILLHLKTAIKTQTFFSYYTADVKIGRRVKCGGRSSSKSKDVEKRKRKEKDKQKANI